MLRKFCYKCGKKEFKEGLCEPCFFENYSILKEEPIEIILCSRCKRMKHKTEWSSDFRKVIKDDLDISKKYSEVEADFTLPTELKKENHIMVSIKGFLEGESIHRNVPIVLKISKKVCPICQKISSGYAEAVLQIRGFTFEKIEKVISKYKQFISKIEEKEGGYDVWFISKKNANDASRGFNATIQRSGKIMGMKNGTTIYRLYLSIKPKIEI